MPLLVRLNRQSGKRKQKSSYAACTNNHLLPKFDIFKIQQNGFIMPKYTQTNTYAPSSWMNREAWSEFKCRIIHIVYIWDIMTLLINNNLFYHLIFTYKSFNVDPNSANVSCRASGHFVCVGQELDGLNAITTVYTLIFTYVLCCRV